jgi:hypothetical protein
MPLQAQMQDMDMAHMRMTPHRPPAPGDSARAAALLVALRAGIQPYTDYHRALADGYRIFAHRVPQPVYHFTNGRLTAAGDWHLDPAHPGSLLYVKENDTTYRLIGAMYSAPQDASLADLDARVPLSVATWHLHTNLCIPKPFYSKARWAERDSTGRARFGVAGSVASRAACEAANGRFFPQVLGWMVHVYPFAPTWSATWSTDELARMHDGKAGMASMPGM